MLKFNYIKPVIPKNHKKRMNTEKKFTKKLGRILHFY